MSATASTRAIAWLAVTLPDATMSSVARAMRRLEDRPAPWRRARDPGPHHRRLRRVCRPRSSRRRLSGQFVIGRVARSGGDREIGGGPGRVAHRLRAQSGGPLLFRPVGRDARLGHSLDGLGEPARMIERMHGAREPGVAFVGRRRVAFRQKIARLPHAVRGLRQCRFVKRGANGSACARAFESGCGRDAQRFERALDRPSHGLDRDHRRAKRSGIEVFRERRAALRHEALDQPRERAHQRQEDRDADHVIGGVIGGEQASRIDRLRRPDDRAASRTETARSRSAPPPA